MTAAEKPHILLTGATGFLGRHLLERLAGDGYFVAALVRRDTPESRIARLGGQAALWRAGEEPLSQAVLRHGINLVIHCATNYGHGEDTIPEVLDANFLLPLRLLQALRSSSDPRIAFLNTDTFLDRRANPYSLSKKQFTEWLPFARDRIRCVNLVLHHLYGPGDNDEKFVTRIIRDLLNRSPALALTAGEQCRDFIYITDAVAAYMHLVRAWPHWPAHQHEYQAGTGERTSIRQFVELARELTGNTSVDLQFGRLPYGPYEHMEYPVDNAALRALGWEPRVPLREGLRAAIEYERQQRAGRAGGHAQSS